MRLPPIGEPSDFDGVGSAAAARRGCGGRSRGGLAWQIPRSFAALGVVIVNATITVGRVRLPPIGEPSDFDGVGSAAAARRGPNCSSSSSSSSSNIANGGGNCHRRATRKGQSRPALAREDNVVELKVPGREPFAETVDLERASHAILLAVVGVEPAGNAAQRSGFGCQLSFLRRGLLACRSIVGGARQLPRRLRGN